MSSTPQPSITEEEKEMLTQAVLLFERKRRLMITGYVACFFYFVSTMLWAFTNYATSHSIFVFLVPFAGMGVLLFLFGTMAKMLKPKAPKKNDDAEIQ